jgi:protoporphyrinogen oxidase
MDNRSDIIIIGAGISGLFAARELSKAGKKVLILEATEKVGGRIREITEDFSSPVDAGAEFIHGDMKITKSLLKEAGGKTMEKKGKFYQTKNGKIVEEEHFAEGWNRIMKELRSLKTDITLSQFLNEHFNRPEDEQLRESVIRLAEGFDAADADKISSFAIREEWSGDSIEGSLQIREGYTMIVNKLYADSRKNGCITFLLTEVNEVNWAFEKVIVKCTNGNIFTASQVIATVSLGILLSGKNERGHNRVIHGIA